MANSRIQHAEWRKQFEAQGIKRTQERIAAGDYAPPKLGLAKVWVTTELEERALDEAARQVEIERGIARDANTIARDSNRIALNTGIVANFIAVVALVVATYAALN